MRRSKKALGLLAYGAVMFLVGSTLGGVASSVPEDDDQPAVTMRTCKGQWSHEDILLWKLDRLAQISLIHACQDDFNAVYLLREWEDDNPVPGSDAWADKQGWWEASGQ